ncbi:hypothetical protein MPER_11160 [Moniliophthora perniciosa FA553]|nr:hypothetical protein MPER_11160 [Moniliophthora perniciosa FA553]
MASRGRNYSENITALHTAAYQLSTKPETYPLYNLRLLPLTIERSAYLSQLQLEEEYARNRAELAYEEERERVEEEWRRGRDRKASKNAEDVPEKIKREKGPSDATLDSQSRPHITRKLRNKIGTSPPPTPLPGAANQPNGANIGAISNMPITTGPFLNPHSLSVDEIPSPYPLPLTATSSSNTGAGAPLGTGAGGTTNNRRRPKGGGAQHNAIGGLGKSLAALSAFKDADIEADLIEIRRGNKKRRAAVQAGKATAQ